MGLVGELGKQGGHPRFFEGMTMRKTGMERQAAVVASKRKAFT
jgi:hypothetical protein